MRRRVEDKRILGLVAAFLRAGILTEEGLNRGTIAGTPQGGILSPLLANIALSVLDEHFTAKWKALGPDWTRAKHRRQGGAVIPPRPLRGRFRGDGRRQRADAEALWDEVSGVLASDGLRLSAEKTGVRHIDEGFDFLGWRIQRRAWRGRSGKRAVYTYPSKKALTRSSTRYGRSPAENATEHSPTCCADSTRCCVVVRLLPPRRLLADIRLPRPLRLLAGRQLDPQTPPRVELGNDPPPLPPGLGDPSRRHQALPAASGRDHAATATGEPGSTHHGRARYDPVESRMRGDVHVRFGGRAEETGRLKSRHRASARPYTYLRCWEGVVFFSFVIDVYSRAVVGWSAPHQQ